MKVIEKLKYDLENDGVIMESINRHFANDSRVKFEIPGVNCPDVFDGFIAIVPCFQDGKLIAKHRIQEKDIVILYTNGGFPQIEVKHGKI